MKNNSRRTFPAIRETFICRAALADYLGRSETYVRDRLNKKSEFSPAANRPKSASAS